MFDYMFYRLYSFYEEKEKGGASTFTAALYLSFLQFLVLYSIIATFQVVTKDSFSTRELLQQYEPYSKYLVLSILILLEIFNYLRYRKKDKQESLQRRFKNHPLNKILKLWMFLTLGVFLIGLPILIHYVIK